MRLKINPNCAPVSNVDFNVAHVLVLRFFFLFFYLERLNGTEISFLDVRFDHIDVKTKETSLFDFLLNVAILVFV